MPEQSYLLEIFEYDPETGKVTNKISRRRARAGMPVGTMTKDGHLQVCLDGAYYALHRIIWKMLYNEEPENVEHANLIGWDNSKVNLRTATHSENMCNVNARHNNRFGVKGLSLKYDRGNHYIQAQVQKDGIRHSRNFIYNTTGLKAATEWVQAQREILHKEFKR